MGLLTEMGKEYFCVGNCDGSLRIKVSLMNLARHFNHILLPDSMLDMITVNSITFSLVSTVESLLFSCLFAISISIMLQVAI